MDGPPIRYVAARRRRMAHQRDQWPPAGATHREWALRADGVLDGDEGEPGAREYMTLGAGLGRVKPSPTRSAGDADVDAARR